MNAEGFLLLQKSNIRPCFCLEIGVELSFFFSLAGASDNQWEQARVQTPLLEGVGVFR